jgi:hypothetical protein
VGTLSRKIIKIACIGMVLILAITTIVLTQISAGRTSNEANDDETIIFSNSPVFVLGLSDNTNYIVNRLEFSTSDITVSDNITSLSSLKPDTIVIIDGVWLGTNSMRCVGDALRPIIIQGNPVIVLNETSDIIRFAIDDLMGWSTSITNGFEDTLCAIHHNPSTNGTNSCTMAVSSDKEFEVAITTLYNWATGELEK